MLSYALLAATCVNDIPIDTHTVYEELGPRLILAALAAMFHPFHLPTLRRNVELRSYRIVRLST